MYYKLLLIMTLLTSNVYGASFNCNQKLTKVEKNICSNTKISKLDEELSLFYKKAMAKESNPEKLKKEQRTWMKQRNRCKNNECLIDEYENRILEFIILNNKKQPMAKDECNDKPECWPEGGAMHTILTFEKKSKIVMKKVQKKHKELVSLISTKEYLADKRLIDAMAKQQIAWENYIPKECELIGLLSDGANIWQSADSVGCRLDLVEERYKKLENVTDCIKKIALKDRQYNFKNCLFQVAPLALPFNK